MKAKRGQKQAVAYYRVSTREQGSSGLGLEAQARSVATFCAGHGYQVVSSYQDIESGKHNDRPELKKALAEAREKSATLIIAKLDRLSRNVRFIYELRDSKADFVACDIPEANPMTIGIMAVLAQTERELISSRTKGALAELKARGRKLGSPKNNLTDATRQRAATTNRAKARAYHLGAMTHAANYRRAGWPLQRIANELNKAGATTRRGHPFTPTTVQRLLAMAEGATP